jgi:hypothetical protein
MTLVAYPINTNQRHWTGNAQNGTVLLSRIEPASGAIVTEPRSESKKRRDIVIYLWLVLSALLNISGIASIVDGLVHWTAFLKDLLSIYRAWIREPISWVVYLAWPSWWPKIPAWVFDVFVIWSACFLTLNIASFREHGESVLKSAVRSQGVLKGTAEVAFTVLTMPLMALVVLAFARDEVDREGREEAKEVLTYLILLVATIIVLMFLNWQLKNPGA